MSLEVTSVSKAELGQLRPPSDADIQRNSDRAGWDQARVQNYRQMMQELSKHASQFVQMQQSPAHQKTQAPQPRAQSKQHADRPAPAATPRHQPVTQSGYRQARGRSITEPRMQTPSIAHLPANVRTAMLRNQQRDQRQQAVRQSIQRLTDRSAGAMRTVSNRLLGRTQLPSADRAQRAGLQQLQAKVATEKRVEKRVEKQAEKMPELFQKYLGKSAPRQQEQQRGKEQERGRDRAR